MGTLATERKGGKQKKNIYTLAKKDEGIGDKKHRVKKNEFGRATGNGVRYIGQDIQRESAVWVH